MVNAQPNMISLDKFSSTSSLADERLLPFNICDSMSAKSNCGSSISVDNEAKQGELERYVWLKLDLWVLPVVTMFYLLSFLVCSPSSLMRLII